MTTSRRGFLGMFLSALSLPILPIGLRGLIESTASPSRLEPADNVLTFGEWAVKPEHNMGVINPWATKDGTTWVDISRDPRYVEVVRVDSIKEGSRDFIDFVA